MRACITSAAAFTLLLPAIGQLRAEKNAELKPALVTAPITFRESFEASALKADWRVNKGQWQVAGSAVVGQEKAEDVHAAVLTLARPFKTAAVRFSFKRDGATGFNVSFNHPKGHLFRVLISDSAMTLNMDKKDPNSKVQMLGKADGKFPAGQWHTLLIEVQGNTVSVTADNGAKLVAKHAGLDMEKTGYRFVTRGQSLLIDDLTIWQAKP